MKTIDFGPAGRYEVLNKIGHGTYGTVYRCGNNAGEILAVKCIPIVETGLPALMEASIMATTNSPGLNSAIAITSGSHNLYLLSELGTADLSRWTNRNKDNYRPTEEQLRRWTFQLLCGLICLNRQNLIHGDIKPSNILIYPDDSVKITDFTLSILAGLPIDHTLYTYPYRPLEIWSLGKLRGVDSSHDDMNQSLHSSDDVIPKTLIIDPSTVKSDIRSDIWALGCSLFEIATGYYLFPVFPKSVPKVEIRQRLIKSILDWHKNGDQEITRGKWCGLPKGFVDLLRDMLRVPIEDRISPIDLIQSSYLTGMTPETYTWIRTPLRRMINVEEYTRIYKWCSSRAELIDERYRSFVIDQAIDLYIKTVRIDMPQELRLIVCFHIAQKIVLIFHEPIKPNIDLNILFEGERKVCTYLGYRLHRDSKNGRATKQRKTIVGHTICDDPCVKEISSLKPSAHIRAMT